MFGYITKRDHNFCYFNIYQSFMVISWLVITLHYCTYTIVCILHLPTYLATWHFIASSIWTHAEALVRMNISSCLQTSKIALIEAQTNVKVTSIDRKVHRKNRKQRQFEAPLSSSIFMQPEAHHHISFLLSISRYTFDMCAHTFTRYYTTIYAACYYSVGNRMHGWCFGDVNIPISFCSVLLR